MKFIIALAALVAGLTGWSACGQGSLNFVGINNVQFNANGDSFQLNPVAGSSLTPQFTFTGTDAGLNGWITGAPWAVDLAGLTAATGGSLTNEQAPVIGGGQLNISDGTNTLTGNLAWSPMHLLSNGQGGVGDSLSLNLTGLTYAGANADLLALAAGGSGNLNLTFQFSGFSPTLGSLFAGNTGTTSTSFSGAISTIAAVPEPATAALFLTSLSLLCVNRWICCGRRAKRIDSIKLET